MYVPLKDKQRQYMQPPVSSVIITKIKNIYNTILYTYNYIVG